MTQFFVVQTLYRPSADVLRFSVLVTKFNSVRHCIQLVVDSRLFCIQC